MNRRDHIKDAIEAKILDAVAMKKWKTLIVSTYINDKGFVVQVATPTQQENIREYQVTVRRIGKGRKGND